MKSTTSILIAAAAALAAQTAALQSPTRIRNSQHLSTQTIPSIYTSTLKDKPAEKEKLESFENNLSPFLQEMVDEQRELQMNVGKAMDVLKSDYPYFLKRSPGEFVVPESAII